MSCSVCHRHGSDPVLLWLWRKPEAEASIPPLAWEPTYAMRAALKGQKTKKKKSLRYFQCLDQNSQSFGHTAKAIFRDTRGKNQSKKKKKFFE